MRRITRALALVAFVLVAPPKDARAQAQGDAKKEAKERKDEDGGKKDAAVATDAAAEPHDLPKAPDAKKDRAERRRRAISYSRARWGALLRQPAAQAELRLHARRIARIDAMESVARAAGKEALLPRIATLRSKETARFEKRMEWVKDGKEGGS